MAEDKRIQTGTYKGRGIAGSEQYGVTSNGNDQVVVDLNLVDLGESVSTFLNFSEAAAQYSIDRLRALGWEGNDLSNLAGIDRNEVMVSVKYETWEGKERMRVEIVTGGGRVTLKDTMDDKRKKVFAARFKGLAASTGGPSAASAQGGANGPADFPYGANAPPQRAGGVKL